MMSKAFMNGDAKMDSFTNVPSKESSARTSGRWNAKKDVSPNGAHITNAGSTTPKMGRTNVKTELSPSNTKDANAGNTTPKMGRFSSKSEISPSNTNDTNGGNTSPNMGRISSKTEISLSNTNDKNGNTSPNMGRINVKKDLSSISASKDTSANSGHPATTKGRMNTTQNASQHNIKQVDTNSTSDANNGLTSYTCSGVLSQITRSDNSEPAKERISQITSSQAKDFGKDSSDSKNNSVPVESLETRPMAKDPATSSLNLGVKKEGKATRFAMRKQKRGKRHRSDGYMLALEMTGASSSDDDPSLGDAVNFLQWIRNPTLQNLAKLRRAVKTNDKDWMTEFLEFDGMGLLFQCLKDLGAIQGFHLTDMVLKMECIMCIREVVNSQTGLDCLLQIKGRKDNIFGRRFASGR